MGVLSLAVKAANAAKKARAAAKVAEAAAKAAKPAARAAKAVAPITKAPSRPSPFAITGKADVGREVLRLKKEQMELKPEKRIQPTGTEPVFDLSRESYEQTPRMFEQSDIAKVQASLPRAAPGAAYPAGNRMAPIIANTPAIADRLAELSQAGKGTAQEYFYHTAPIVQGLLDQGVPRASALEFLQKKFAPTFAGTSPRTATEQNMRNASLLMYMRKQGIPFDETFYDQFGNLPGYNMMGSHYGLSSKMLEGTHDPLTNPKPSSFLPNTAGDLSYVTADTHNIRGAVKAFNDIRPGELPLEWLKPAARENYRQTGIFNPATDVDDSLRTAVSGGRDQQVEYGPMADVTFEAARRSGALPGPMQSLGWFGSGADTGLVSATKTIPELMNERINVTAQALGISPQAALKILSEGGMPVMAEGGSVDTQKLADKYGM